MCEYMISLGMMSTWRQTKLTDTEAVPESLVNVDQLNYSPSRRLLTVRQTSAEILTDNSPQISPQISKVHWSAGVPLEFVSRRERGGGQVHICGLTFFPLWWFLFLLLVPSLTSGRTHALYITVNASRLLGLGTCNFFLFFNRQIQNKKVETNE